jgi:thioredoxin reductase
LPAVSGVVLQRKLRQQAEELGVDLVRANVVSARGREGGFLLESEEGTRWRGKTLLLATGVSRYHPTVDGDYRPCFRYAGKGNLFYCPDCDAPKISGKETLVIGVGAADSAAAMAVGLSRYTDRLRVLLTADTAISPRRLAQLEGKGIAVFSGSIERLEGEPSRLRAVHLFDGTVLAAEAFLVSTPARGRTDLAEQLGVEMAPTGNHVQPRSQRGDTNVPGVWVAGDLRPITQQVAVAMGTGNIAAVMIDQYLRRQDVL